MRTATLVFASLLAAGASASASASFFTSAPRAATAYAAAKRAAEAHAANAASAAPAAAALLSVAEQAAAAAAAAEAAATEAAAASAKAAAQAAAARRSAGAALEEYLAAQRAIDAHTRAAEASLAQAALLHSGLAELSPAWPVAAEECILLQMDPANPGQVTFVHDLTPLYNGLGYSFVNVTTGQMFVFTVCGGPVQPLVPTDKTGACTNSSVYKSRKPCTIDSKNVEVPGTEAQTYTYCNADYNTSPFAARAMTFLEFTYRNVTYGNGGRRTCLLGGSPNKGFRPPDIADVTGLHNYCSTGQCINLGPPSSAPVIRLANETDPSAGLVIQIAGPAANSGADFVCPTDPFTGFSRTSSTIIYLRCDAVGSVTDPLKIENIYDNGDCIYRIFAAHKSACGREASCKLGDLISGREPAPAGVTAAMAGPSAATARPPAAPVALSPASSCLIFETDPSAPSTVTYAYDLTPISTGGRGISWYNSSTAQYFVFEVCGGGIKPAVPVDASGKCTPEIAYENSAKSRYGSAPSGGWPGVKQPQGCAIPGTSWETFTYCNAPSGTFPFSGNVMQFFEYRPPAPGQPPSKITHCQLGGQPGTVAGSWTPPNSFGPNSNGYANFCGTSQCEVLSSSPGVVRALDRTNRTAGISITFLGSSPDNGDAFQCPTDPSTGYARVRQTVVYISCVPGKVNTPLVVKAVYDNGDCLYRVVAEHPSACGYEVTCNL